MSERLAQRIQLTKVRITALGPEMPGETEDKAAKRVELHNLLKRLLAEEAANAVPDTRLPYRDDP